MHIEPTKPACTIVLQQAMSDKDLAAAAMSAGFSVEEMPSSKDGFNLMYKGEATLKGFWKGEMVNGGDSENGYEDVKVLPKGSQVLVKGDMVQWGYGRPGKSDRGDDTMEVGTLDGETFKPK